MARKEIIRVTEPGDWRRRKRKARPFESLVKRNEETGCLEWIARKDKDGYGVAIVDRNGRRAHRVAYEKEYGEIPEGMIVRHNCDNPACCEPTHLTLGTQADNIKDKIVRDRQAKGSRMANALLTEEMVLEIRELHRQGIKQNQIAKRFPVTISSISLIIRRKQWKHI